VFITSIAYVRHRLTSVT